MKVLGESAELTGFPRTSSDVFQAEYNPQNLRDSFLKELFGQEAVLLNPEDTNLIRRSVIYRSVWFWPKHGRIASVTLASI
jgi:hypothetical protein